MFHSYLVPSVGPYYGDSFVLNNEIENDNTILSQGLHRPICGIYRTLRGQNVFGLKVVYSGMVYPHYRSSIFSVYVIKK